MKLRRITIHQTNMYCSKCLLNVLMALSIVDHIESFDIDLESKNITLEYKDDRFGKAKIKDLINRAINKGRVLEPAF